MSDSSWQTFQMQVIDSPSTVGGGTSPASANSIAQPTRSRARTPAFNLTSVAQQQLQFHQQQQNQQHPSLLTQRTTNTTSQQNVNLALEQQQQMAFQTAGIGIIQNSYAVTMPALQTTFDPNIGVAPTEDSTTNSVVDISSEATLNLLSLSIRENTTGGMKVMEEQNLCQTITKKYSKDKDRHFRWFLEEIVNHCGPDMAKLASSTVQLPDRSKLNAFVHVVVGQRTSARYNILNYALLAFVTNIKMKQKYGHKQKGDVHEPSSMCTMLKSISSHLDCCTQRSPNGACKYSLHKDFRGTGGAISNLQALWKVEMKKDPQFGRKPFASIFDHKAFEKVEKALQDLLLLIVFVQGFKFWLRGCSEQHERQWRDYTFSTQANVENLYLVYLKTRHTSHTK